MLALLLFFIAVAVAVAITTAVVVVDAVVVDLAISEPFSKQSKVTLLIG